MVQIAIRVSPRSGRPGIGAWRTDADGREELEVRVAEAPSDGAANDSVIRLLAKAFDVSKGSIDIVSGETSRRKRVEVPLSSEEARRRIGG